MAELTRTEAQVWTHLFVMAFLKRANSDNREMDLEMVYAIANSWADAHGMDVDPEVCAAKAVYP